MNEIIFSVIIDKIRRHVRSCVRRFKKKKKNSDSRMTSTPIIRLVIFSILCWFFFFPNKIFRFLLCRATNWMYRDRRWFATRRNVSGFFCFLPVFLFVFLCQRRYSFTRVPFAVFIVRTLVHCRRRILNFSRRNRTRGIRSGDERPAIIRARMLTGTLRIGQTIIIIV